MSTFAEITKEAESTVSTFVDDATPAGHFIALANIIGVTTGYLLEGDKDDTEALIKGRVELPSLDKVGIRHPIAYKGGGLKGGTFNGIITDHGTGFEEMLARFV